MRKSYHILYLLLAFSLIACSPREVRTAQAVVRTAESLWQEGKMYDDSLSLAQAYETLGRISRYLLPITNHQLQITSTYAHACYHYGRLLREKDDPVTAMQVFINATHSRTRDYHILGRIYSNMGDLCHLANEFQLAYDMYEQSADAYLHNGDTLLYYYDLNNMAFEMAELADTCMCRHHIQAIENVPELHELSTMTLAEMYLKNSQYDSAIYYANELTNSIYLAPVVLIIKAQAYSELGVKDSAIQYANYVLKDTLSPYQHRFNALFILSHNDSTLNTDEVRNITSEREDIRYYDYEPLKEKLTQAILLLEQDLSKGVNWLKWTILGLVVLFIIGCLTFVMIGRKRKLQMQKHVTLLTDKHADSIIESIKQHIDTTDINNTLHWKNYAALKSDADLYMGGIVSKLEGCNLNEVEIRFCILTMLDFRLKQIAETIHYGYPSGIKTLKKRVSDKLGTTPPELKNFLLHKL